MTEAEWMQDNKPFKMVQHLGHTTSIRKLRLYCHACIVRILPRVTDARFQRAFTVLEQSADGLALREEVNDVRGEVRDVAEGTGADTAFYSSLIADDTVHAHYYTDSLMGAVTQEVIKASVGRKGKHIRKQEERGQAALLREIYGNPFRPVTFPPSWRTDTAVSLARTMYESRDFSAMPILADALQDAGCDSDDVLNHCRGEGPHVRGCWVVDLVLGKG